MQLPGQLRQTTLGDLLGMLCRARIVGVLELFEANQRVHRIHLREGWVVDVETSIDSSSDAFDPRSSWSHRECHARLEPLFSLRDASIRFRVARPLNRSASRVPSSPTEFLRGRPRKRSRESSSVRDRRSTLSEASDPRSDARRRALATLGLGGHASVTEVTQAFRRLARTLHPDLHRGISATDEARLSQRFAEVSAAYHTLVP